MTKRDHATLERYIRTVADEMGLADWVLNFSDEPADDGCWANCTLTYGQKRASVRVSPNFRDEDPEEQRDTIVHELVHAHLEPSAAMVRDDLQDLLGKPADTLFWRSFRRQFEYGVDGLAGAIAKHMPLIDWE